MNKNQADLITKSFRGVNIMLFISRMLLLAQYLRETYGYACGLCGALQGEGLNAICGTLRSGMNALGLSKTMVGQSLTMLLILYFIWLLYFDGFRINYSPRKILEELWLCLHFPLHLSLILLLEGVKNVFIYANLMESINRLNKAVEETWDVFYTTGQFPEHPPLEKLLIVLNLSWQQEEKTILDAMAKDLADLSGDQMNVGIRLWRWWGDVIHRVIMLYNDDKKDPEAESKFQTFNQSNDTAIEADLLNEDSPLLTSFYCPYFDQMAYTGHWIVAVGGTLILCMAIINTMQRRPRNRFAWGYNLSRSIIGIALIILGGFTSGWIKKDEWIIWILPAIAIGYGIAVIVERFILFFSIHSIRDMESVSRSAVAYSSVEKGDRDPGTGVDLAHLSHLPYGYGKPHRSESEPAGIYAHGPVGSSDSLYAAGGEAKKLYEESHDHLPEKP
ncbi:hypothetical protein FS837_009197 [Tulasnella sp. UAMH 9824]|nr:hypothetical protein FS837_009197 [Tulasnella sp. UAMH 9824]